MFRYSLFCSVRQYPKPLIDRLKSELSGALEDLVLAVIKGQRQEDVVRMIQNGPCIHTYRTRYLVDLSLIHI